MTHARIVPAMILFCALPAVAQLRAEFDTDSRTWTVSNSRIRAAFRLDDSGRFILTDFQNNLSRKMWRPPVWLPSSPIALDTSIGRFDANSSWTLVSTTSSMLPRGGRQAAIVLDDIQGRVRVYVDLEVYAFSAALRYRVRLQNLLTRGIVVRGDDLAPWTFDSREPFVAFWVDQWVHAGKAGPVSRNFGQNEYDVAGDGNPVVVQAGAHGQHSGWLALRNQARHGLFTGWEFDGRVDASFRRFEQAGYAALSAPILKLNRPVGRDQFFEGAWAFLGAFTGEWDAAAQATHRFVETALAKPVPDAEKFPYVIWDSWKYQTAIDEAILRRNAEIAARLGIEVFVIDLGWARQIGDWRADPAKFPSGLRALSDYVHSLGMKFGLHFAFAEAMPQSPVLVEHPDWRSTKGYDYFGADSLCLSHRPVREWLVNEAVRMIDEYGVDWIVQDGENMVKFCSSTGHSHDPLDSNYANAVDGLNWVVEEIQRRRPDTLWENCEDGGNMMTFNMVRNYVTSIACDDSGPDTSRQAVYGVTYPFSPRYADRYMPDESLSPYTTRSFLFGGPWIFMNKLAEMKQTDLDLASGEIALYKSLRRRIREGRVFHLAAPDLKQIDAIQSHHEASDTAVIVVHRPDVAQDQITLKPAGLNPAILYRVKLHGQGQEWVMSGRDLAGQGIQVTLPARRSSELMWIERVPQASN